MSIRYHKDEVIRWLNAPEGTRLWYKSSAEGKWKLLDDEPQWVSDFPYIVDDEFAEILKQFVDDRSKVQRYRRAEEEWRPTRLTDLGEFTRELILYPKRYRIKPEEQVYEWQWTYKIDSGERYAISSYCSEDEVSNPKWVKFEPSKRVRNDIR